MLHRYIRLRTVKGYVVNDASNAKYYRRVLISRCHITLHPLSDPTIFKSYRIRRRRKKKKKKEKREEEKERRKEEEEKKRNGGNTRKFHPMVFYLFAFLFDSFG